VCTSTKGVHGYRHKGCGCLGVGTSTKGVGVRMGVWVVETGMWSCCKVGHEGMHTAEYRQSAGRQAGWDACVCELGGWGWGGMKGPERA
jgi:hypothetical protein